MDRLCSRNMSPSRLEPLLIPGPGYQVCDVSCPALLPPEASQVKSWAVCHHINMSNPTKHMLHFNPSTPLASTCLVNTLQTFLQMKAWQV